MSYDNTNRGQIWKTEVKRNPKEPDYRIELNFDGLDLVIPVWKRAAGANPKAPPYTFKIERKADPIATGRDLPSYPHKNDLDDDVPF